MNQQKPQTMTIQYALPENWVQYDIGQVAEALVEAKAAALSLRTIPYQRIWVERLQEMQLKREVAGTSRIEGAEFTERELDAAMREDPEQLKTRSQRQARAATNTYRWISTLSDDTPIDEGLIREIHRRIVTGADDDHCPPGKLRGADQDVTFGIPRHRGVEGGRDCETAFSRLSYAIQHEMRTHDPLIQGLAAHYQLAAMHPFYDGNGRTARAMEAIFLQRSGLRDTCFIAMSNYYYEEKDGYLAALAAVRKIGHDLTPFLVFGLRGIASRSGRLLDEIKHNISKELFRNLMHDLFGRLKTPRKRVVAERQIAVLKLLLRSESISLDEIIQLTSEAYRGLKSPTKALFRDLNDLIALGAIDFERISEGKYRIFIRLDWPTRITESAFFEQISRMPKAKTHPFL